MESNYDSPQWSASQYTMRASLAFPACLAIVYSLLAKAITFAAGEELDVKAIVQRAEGGETDALWELKNAPLQDTFKVLRDLWLIGEGTVEQREGWRRAGKEEQWLAIRRSTGENPDQLAILFPI